MSNTLKGQRVVVFGGGSGAGLASAKLLASHGAEVIIAGRDQKQLDDARAGFGGPVKTKSVDGKDTAAVRAFFDEVGEFDHLVITAGATDRGGAFVTEMTEKTLRETFEGKFFVQMTAAREGGKHVRRGGSITFFSGGANRRAMAGMSNVAAVNGAIDAVVPALAVELGPTRVNSISPGTLHTSYWAGLPEQTLQEIFGRMAKALPAGRVGTGEDIANAVFYLVSTSYVTGTVLAIDGGLPHASL